MCHAVILACRLKKWETDRDGYRVKYNFHFQSESEMSLGELTHPAKVWHSRPKIKRKCRTVTVFLAALRAPLSLNLSPADSAPSFFLAVCSWLLTFLKSRLFQLQAIHLGWEGITHTALKCLFSTRSPFLGKWKRRWCLMEHFLIVWILNSSRKKITLFSVSSPLTGSVEQLGVIWLFLKANRQDLSGRGEGLALTPLTFTQLF